MRADTPLDYAVFQLSPKRTRCELFVSGRGETEKLASGLLKPFITHLRAAEEQAARTGHLIKLEIPENQNEAPWFTKGTLERFVRFVSTPEVLELVNTVDAEMSQLEAARNFQLALYSQGCGDQHSSLGSGTDVAVSGAPSKSSETEAADTSKRELLRAIDVRLMALQQELSMAFARASAAGFAIEHMTDLIVFADRFGANRLKDACAKFMSLCQKHHDVGLWGDDADTRSSGSDMSIENGTEGEVGCDSPSDPFFKQGDKSHGYWSEGGNRVIGNQTSVSIALQPQQEQEGEKPSHSRAQSFDHRESICSSSGGPKHINSWEKSSIANNFLAKPPMNKPDTEASSESVGTGPDKYNQSRAVTNSSRSCSPRRRSFSPTRRVQTGKTGPGVITSNSYVDDQSNRERRSNRESSDSDAESDVGHKQEPEPVQKAQPIRRLSVQDRINLFESKQKEQQRDSSEGIRKIGKVENRRLSSESGNSIATEKAVLRRWSGASDMSVELATPQQTKNGNGKEASAPWAKNNSEVPVWPSENSVQASSIGRDQGQVEASTPQTEFRPLTHKPGLVEEGKDMDSRLASPPKVIGQQQVQTAVAENPEPISDYQGTKPSGASLVSSVEQIPNMAKQLTTPVQFNEQPDRKDSPEKYRRIESSRAARQDDGSMNTKRHVVEGPVPKLKQSKGNQELNEELREKANQLEAFFAAHKLRSQAAAEPADEAIVTGRKSTSSAVKMEGATAQEKIHASSRERKPETCKFTIDEPDKVFAMPLRNVGRESLGSSWSNGVDFDMHALMNMADRSYSNNSEKKFGLGDNGFSEELRGKYYERYMEKRDAKLREEPIIKRAQREAKLKAMQEALERSKAEMAARSARSLEKRDPLAQARLRAEKLRSFNVRASKNRKQQIETEQSDDEEETNDLYEQTFYRQDRIITFSTPTELFSPCASKELPKPNSVKKLSSNKSMPSTTPRSSISLTSPSPRSSMPVKVSSTSSTTSGRRRSQENPLAQSVPNFADLRKENTKPSAGRTGLISNLEKTGAATRGQSKSSYRSKSGSEDFPLEANGSAIRSANSKEDKNRRSQAMRKSCASVSELKDISAPTYEGVVLAPLKVTKEASEPIFYNKGTKKNSVAPLEPKPFLRKGNGIGPGAGPGVAKMKASLAADTLKNAEDGGQVGDQTGEETVEGLENLQSADALEGIAEGNEVDKLTGDVAETSDVQGESDASQNDIHVKAELNQTSDRSDDGVSDSDTISRTLSQVNDASISHFQMPSSAIARNQGHGEEMASRSGIFSRAGHAASLPHKHTAESSSLHMSAVSAHFSQSVAMAQDSPGESPASWNSHMHHSLSQMLEASDVEASADSPMGSPASWNSHSLSQMMEASDTDAARTRKKWGSAQKPVLVVSQQSHKDVPKGFKRLLKFGRKSRGSETVTTDWVSASTTSEGDDDTEDTRDLAVRSADDLLRKSRMGSVPMHPSYDRSYDYGSISGSVEGESFHEQGTIQSLRSSIPAPPANFKLREDHLAGGTSLKAPRSFFSLSSFRSKGSDAKSR
eukprot:Gb_39029 [translate_table: standard]